jgi:hypothetical protein
MDQSGLASRPVRNASSGGRRRSWDQVRLFSLFCCARWRRMVGLDRIARPLLSIVKGKRHATTEDHEPDNKRAPDSANADSESESDNDNDRSGLGQLPKKKPTRLHVPQHNRTTGSSVIPAKRGAEPDDELDNSSFKSSSSQSKRPLKTFGKKPSFTARNKPARQQEKTGWAHRRSSYFPLSDHEQPLPSETPQRYSPSLNLPERGLSSERMPRPSLSLRNKMLHRRSPLPASARPRMPLQIAPTFLTNPSP